jgi:hypothetical protein
VLALAVQRRAAGADARRVVADVKRIQAEAQRLVEARWTASDLRAPPRDAGSRPPSSVTSRRAAASRVDRLS